MRGLLTAIGLSVILGAHSPVSAQITRPDTLSRAQVVAVARDIMQAARYCTFITIGPGGQPDARIVDPFLPDSELTIWIATNPLTRKVQDIQRDPRIALLYFNPATFEYVTVLGTAALDTDSLDKAGHWKPEWAGLYRDQNHGADYLLLRIRPTRFEVVSARRGLRNDPRTWRPVIVDVP
jgi:general stress protein 26